MRNIQKKWTLVSMILSMGMASANTKLQTSENLYNRSIILDAKITQVVTKVCKSKISVMGSSVSRVKSKVIQTTTYKLSGVGENQELGERITATLKTKVQSYFNKRYRVITGIDKNVVESISAKYDSSEQTIIVNVVFN